MSSESSTMRRNLLIPLRRDRKRDLASGAGAELLRSKVTQVLATEGSAPGSSGELPWRTAFGSAIHLLRHRRNDEALAELARIYARDALQMWLPSIQVVSVEVRQDDAKLTLHVRFVGGGSSAPEDVEVPL
jgi:Bacteriophage baseplate protein W